MQTISQNTQAAALQEAIKIAGSQKLLAQKISDKEETVHQYQISRWLKDGGTPPEFVLKVEAATKVSRHKLHPKIYPRERKQK